MKQHIPRNPYRTPWSSVSAAVVAGIFTVLCVCVPAGIATGSGITSAYYFEPFDEETEEEVYGPDYIAETETPVIYGSFRLNIGYINDEFTIREANYSLQEKTWRYLFGEDRYNTYDPAVYNQLKLNILAPLSREDRIFAKVVVDPWAFVGKTQEVTLPTYYEADDGTGTTPVDDPVTLRLRYWSNNSRVFPGFVRSSAGDTFALPEAYVSGGYNEAFRVTGQYGFETHRLDVPSLKFSEEFKPMRSLWYDRTTEEYRLLVFAWAEVDMGLYSDDPLRLMNNHINWEPTPWIDKWLPGRNYSGSGPEDGRWTQEYFLRDSGGNFLTLLRGVRWEGEIAGWQSQAMVAAPLDPWEDYDTVNNVPLGVRLKHDLAEYATLGAVYTARWGFVDGSEDVFDHAVGIDVRGDIVDEMSAFGEVAYSENARNRKTDVARQDTDDIAYQVGIEGPFAPFDIAMQARATFTRMGRDFDPPLSNYRHTRDDQGWGRHIWFSRRTPEEESYRIGNSIDADRRVAGLDLTVKDAEGLNSRFNVRHVNRDTDGEYIETIFRNETTYQATAELLAKFLIIQHQREKTDQGKDQNTLTFAAGCRYDFSRQLAFEQIVERTNEYPAFPDGLYYWLTINPDPPYPYYWISKTRLLYEPWPFLEISLENTYNEFNYAATFDDYMSYSGTQMLLHVTPECDLAFVYLYSRVATDFQDDQRTGHHNVFAELRYKVGPRSVFTLTFGQLAEYIEGLGWQSAVLDTRHIVRAVFRGEF